MRNEHEEFLRATMGSMDLVFNLSRRLLRNPADAEDLVQDTFLSAYRAWVDERRPRKVEPWIATICLNLARSRYRSAGRRPREVPIEDVPERAAAEPGPEDLALGALTREALELTMEALPEEQRVAITLVDLGGLSTREAAEAMGTPRGTVLSRVHRGRRALAALLEDEREETSS